MKPRAYGTDEFVRDGNRLQRFDVIACSIPQLNGKFMGYTLRFNGQDTYEEDRQAAIELIDVAISEGHRFLEIICSEDAEPLTVVDVLDWREVNADCSPSPSISN